MSKNRQPDLMFLDSTDSVGFTAAGISSFRDTSASAIVRELIQNSLDAAQDVQVFKAVVQFSTTQVATEDIPGIESYRTAFKKAVKRRTTETGLGDQEMMVVETICEALNRDRQDVLVVTDNGVGLDKKRMDALMSDGASDKAKHATGAFGVGHMSVFPLSDLRYILYGGICDKRWIGSGHAILASHDKDRKNATRRSANGFYLAENKGRIRIYPDKDELPPLIRKTLSDIKRRHGCGTAVIVPAFNQFKENKISLKDAVSEAAACSFFPAVDKGRPEVIVDDSNTLWTLNRGSLNEELSCYKERKQGRGYLSGQKAYFSYNALVRGARHDVNVLDGVVKIVIHHPAQSGTTRINLFRNGMWITNSISRLSSAFSDHEAFEALILITAQLAPEFHDLIRKSEGPSHNRLDLKLLTPEDRKKLDKAFDVVIEFLRNEIPKFSDEPYNPSDFLAFADDAENSSGRDYGWNYRGIVTPIHQRISMQRLVGANPSDGRSGGNGGGSGESKENSQHGQSARRPALSSNFTAVVTPAGQDRKRIKIRCIETCDNLELRLVVDDRTDVTTDRIWPDRLASIKSAKIDGTPVAPEAVLTAPYPAIRLGRLYRGTTEIEVEYALDGDTVPVSPDASLRVEIGVLRVDTTGGEQSE